MNEEKRRLRFVTRHLTGPQPGDRPGSHHTPGGGVRGGEGGEGREGRERGLMCDVAPGLCPGSCPPALHSPASGLCDRAVLRQPCDGGGWAG